MSAVATPFRRSPAPFRLSWSKARRRVLQALLDALDRLVPKTGSYRHGEGNSDSHIKSVLVGGSQVVFVEDGRLALGRWQGIFFCEFDGPRERKLIMKLVAE